MNVTFSHDYTRICMLRFFSFLNRRGRMKSRLSVAVAAAVAMATSLAAGCSSSPATQPASGANPAAAARAAATIPLLTGGDVGAYSTIDPNQTEGCNDNYCGLFMEHLLQPGPNSTLQPELATSWAQTSPVTYVYHLRTGVTFWDGTPMTSADVVYSLEYQQDGKGPNSAAVNFTNVKSLAADGPSTVVITLKQPDNNWKYTLSYEGVIFEKKFAEAHQGTLGSPGVLIQASGPWQVTSYDPTRGMELSANPHWWGGKVPVQHITVKFFSTESSEALAMRAGEIDVAFPGNGTSFASSAGSGAHVTSWPSPQLAMFAMNVKQAPWNDVHVRRAVADALNRTDIIAANGGSLTARPASTVISPTELATVGSPSQVTALLNALPQYPYDLAKAKQELAQSAYPHGFTATTDIDNGTVGATDVNDIQVIAAELQKIGITLKVKEVSENAYINAYTNAPGGDLFEHLGAVSPDPGIFPSYCLDSTAPFNVAHYASPTVDSLLAKGVSSGSPAQRLASYGQVLAQVATDVPYVTLLAPNSFTALSSKYTLPAFPAFAGFFSWALGIKQA
jgi:peptide/nickel transport system substrate-binding protein